MCFNEKSYKQIAKLEYESDQKNREHLQMSGFKLKE